MLSTELIESLNPTPVEKPRDPGAMGRDEFLRMLIAQLENQDPLNPQDSTEFTAQLATFSSLEQLFSIRDSINRLVAAQESTDTLRGLELVGHGVLAQHDRFEVGEANSALPNLVFELPESTTRTALEVFDANGRLVRQMELGAFSPGRQELVWDGNGQNGSRLAPGVYRFQVAAQNGGRAVSATEFISARVTGSTLEGENPTLRLGQITVPFSSVIEIREAE